jgi:hypothetical protein
VCALQQTLDSFNRQIEKLQQANEGIERDVERFQKREQLLEEVTAVYCLPCRPLVSLAAKFWGSVFMMCDCLMHMEM